MRDLVEYLLGLLPDAVQGAKRQEKEKNPKHRMCEVFFACNVAETGQWCRRSSHAELRCDHHHIENRWKYGCVKKGERQPLKNPVVLLLKGWSVTVRAGADPSSMPTKSQKAAGCRIDPPVSEAKMKGWFFNSTMHPKISSRLLDALNVL